MFSLVILSAALMGQTCASGSCFSGSVGGFSGGFPQQSFSQWPQPCMIQPQTVSGPSLLSERPETPLVKRKIRHDGMDFFVEGTQNRDGSIRWSLDRPYNTASYDAALELRRKKTVAKAIPTARLADELIVPREPDSKPAVADIDKPVAVDEPKPTAQAPPKGSLPPQNFGLNPEKIGLSKEAYTATSAAAKRFVAEAAGDDSDKSKIHVTVIGNDDDRARVANDIATDPAFEKIRDDLLVQGYKPGEWAVDASLGFKNDGNPSIVVQSSKSKDDPIGGRVLYRSSNYDTGAKGLAEALRKANPNYKPDLDPTPDSKPDESKPYKLPFGLKESDLPTVFFVAIGLAILLKLPRKAG